ncbi:hypothetical protein FPV67DRAFT_1470648 [Lyophyllum atratum]|nr:hypothetical protein FPV67DRAFT_1470648 [Lyophyllum atratum]
MPSLVPQPGPSLPPFKTLLVKGIYHPSAPVHLSLSGTSEATKSHAIIISPSRQKLTLALQQYNDEWLKLNSGTGSVSSLSSRVKLFYPPSPAHLCLLLSMLIVPDPDSLEKENVAWLNNKTTLPISPSLIVLHEPSAYFLSRRALHRAAKWTINSYLSLITHALSSSTGVSFALFDSQLDQLRLPMLVRPTSRHDDDQNSSAPRHEPVYNFAQKYFEWVVVADEEDPSVHSTRKKKTMVLHRNGQHRGPVKSWEWWEGHDMENQDERQATRLFWQDLI